MRPKPILVYMQKQMQGRLCAEMAHLVPPSLPLSLFICRGANMDDDHATMRGVTGTGRENWRGPERKNVVKIPDPRQQFVEGERRAQAMMIT